MKKKPFLFLIVLFLSMFQLFSQSKEFSKVTKEELAATKHHLDSTASASVIFSFGRISFKYDNGWMYVYEVEKRIKIYDKEGYDEATVKIPYYVGSNNSSSESVSKIKAITYNLEGNKIATTKIKKSDVYDEEVNDFYKLKGFTLPEIKDGTIIEYSYQITSPFITSFPQWFFQESIPVDYSLFITEIPEFFAYRQYATGFHEIAQQSQEKNVTFSFRYDVAGSSGPNYVEAPRTEMGSVNARVNYIYLEAEDLPKVEPENYVHNINNYRSSVKFEQTGYRNPNETEYKFRNLSWEDVVKTIQKSDRFGGELKRDKYLSEDTHQLTKDLASDEEKAVAILQYLQNRMTWNGFNGVYTSKRLDKIYEEQTGNVADINLIQTKMMRLAGLNAYPVLLSTRSNGIPIAPTINGMNYVVTAVKLNENYVLFDAADKFSAPNLLSEKTLNWFGRMIQDNGYAKEINLTPKTASTSFVSLFIDLHEDGSLSGQVRKQLTHYEASRYRRRYLRLKRDSYIESLENNYGGIQITDHAFTNLNDLSQPLIETFAFEVNELTEQIGEQVYLNPLAFLATNSHTLKQDVRNYPIDFSYPKNERFLVTINLPEGYEVEWVPENAALALPNNMGTFQYVASGAGNQIKLNVSTSINTTILNQDYYPYLKEFFDQLVSKETEQVIIKKV